MYNVVSLFSGCGGIDLGFTGDFDYLGEHFSKLPFRMVWANDWDKEAMAVYNHNFDASFSACDVRAIDFAGVEDGSSQVDVLIAGFPCQGFSLSGPREGLGSERGRLYTEIRRALGVFRPKIFLAENVPGIEYPPSTFEIILHALSEGGDS